MDNRVLGLDVSHWQDEMDYQALVDGGVKVLVAKCSQGLFSDHAFKKHYAGALSVGLKFAAYHWDDPILPVAKAVKVIKETLAGKPEISFIAIDVEQYWANWAEWARHRIVHVLPPRRISDHARAVAVGIANLDIPVWIYTRMTFIRDHAMPMWNWVQKYPLWLARYPIHPPKPFELSWDELKTHKAYSYSIDRNPYENVPWLGWQWSGDRFKLPGTDGAADLNWFILP